MSFADKPSGQRLPAIVVTALVHAAGLALAASAFHVAQTRHGNPDGLRVTVFRSQPSPAPAEPPERKSKPAPEKHARKAMHRSAGRTSQIEPQAIAIASHPSEILPAPAEAGQAPSPKLPATTEPDTAAPGKEDLLAAYAAQLRQRILERRPRGLRKDGTATVAFQIDHAGQLAGSAIAVSSGNVQLDRVALRMVRQAAPFPEPPGELPASKLHFSLSIHFH